MHSHKHRTLARLITASCFFLTPIAAPGNPETASPTTQVGVWTTPDKLTRGMTTGVLLTRKEDGRPHHCTATSIGNTYILTAAGCFYPDGKLTQHAVFIPGQERSDRNPFGRFRVAGIYHPSTFEPAPSDVQHPSNSLAVAYVENNANSKRLSAVVGGRGFWGKRLPEPSKISIYGYPFLEEGEGRPYIDRNCVGIDYASAALVSNCAYFPGLDGAPILFTHDDNNQYIVGVVTGYRNKNDATGVKLTPERQRILDALNKGEYSASTNTFKEPWKHIKLDPPRLLSVSVRNNCNIPVSVAFSTLSSLGQWIPSGLFQIMPGRVEHLFETPFLTFRLSIVDASGRELLSGSVSRTIQDGSRQSFAEIERTRFGEYEYTTSSNPSPQGDRIMKAFGRHLEDAQRAPC